MRVVSWNVNGIRAGVRHGFVDFVDRSGADIVSVQEVRARPEDIPPAARRPPGWHTAFTVAERRGYSGVGLYSKLQPVRVETSLGVPRFDREGRFMVAHFQTARGRFVVVNGYFPKGSGPDRDNSRVGYKLDFSRTVFGRALPWSLSDADRGVTSDQRRRWRAGRRARVRRLPRQSRAVRQLHALLMPSRQLRGRLPAHGTRRSNDVGFLRIRHRTDAKALTQRRRGLGGESTQVTVVVHDLDGESEPATGERPEGLFRRGGRRIDRAAAPSAAAFEERLVGERVEGLSQLGRRGDDDLLQRDHRRGAGFDRRPARDLEVAHHLDRPVRGLRDGGRLASQDRPRGGLGIHGVGLPGDSTVRRSPRFTSSTWCPARRTARASPAP